MALQSIILPMGNRVQKFHTSKVFLGMVNGLNGLVMEVKKNLEIMLTVLKMDHGKVGLRMAKKNIY